MKPYLLSTLFGTVMAVALAGTVQAEQVEHFEGKQSETLEQAVANFIEYNGKLEQLLAAELDAKALYEIHMLTYTLENALGKINEEMAQLADTLEAVHQASEHNDAQTALDSGRVYLEVSRQVIPH